MQERGILEHRDVVLDAHKGGLAHGGEALEGKEEGTFTTSTVFQLPTSETFAGLSNYVYGVIKMGFLSSLGYSLV
ncbi:hypothetical protein R2O95_14420, partial [Faecalibacterium duncaniae]|nr:hypothetical protein [Faecalibacterium duncaniae]